MTVRERKAARVDLQKEPWKRSANQWFCEVLPQVARRAWIQVGRRAWLQCLWRRFSRCLKILRSWRSFWSGWQRFHEKRKGSTEAASVAWSSRDLEGRCAVVKRVETTSKVRAGAKPRCSLCASVFFISPLYCVFFFPRWPVGVLFTIDWYSQW